MLIRLLLLLCIVLIVVSGVLYLLTDNPRYLNTAWQIVRTAVLAGFVMLLLVVLERYALVGWGVL
ncbi:MAG TPA: hypothetical protein VFR06_03775, partial [Gallionellaceae bacterium]|nr:hypothetical protein [Gallionellaceae bacterium]